MEVVILTLWTLVILSVFVCRVTPIKCYQCSTSKNITCPSGDSSSSFIVDCEAYFNSQTKLTDFDYDEKLLNSGNGIPLPARIEKEDYEMMQSNFKNSSYEPVCMKNSFFIKDWIVEESGDVEIKKRMTKSRVTYYCGYLPNEHAHECVSKNTRAISQTQCACSNNLCNGSGEFRNRPTILFFTILMFQLISDL